MMTAEAYPTAPFLGMGFQSRPSDQHRWYAITCPKLNPRVVACVNLTSDQGGQWWSETCLIQPGELGCSRLSCFVYIEPLRTSAAKLKDALTARALSICAPLVDPLLTRVQLAAFDADDTEDWCKDLLREQGFGPPNGD